MCIYLKNIPAGFQPDLILNDGRHLEEGSQNKNNNTNKMSSDRDQLLIQNVAIVTNIPSTDTANNLIRRVMGNMY